LQRDKLLQLNFANVSIENTLFKNSKTCVMFKGGQNIRIKNSRFVNCERAIAGSTQEGIVGKISTEASFLEVYGNIQRDSLLTVFNRSKRFISLSGDVEGIEEGNRLPFFVKNEIKDGALLR